MAPEEVEAALRGLCTGANARCFCCTASCTFEEMYGAPAYGLFLCWDCGYLLSPPVQVQPLADVEAWPPAAVERMGAMGNERGTQLLLAAVPAERPRPEAADRRCWLRDAVIKRQFCGGRLPQLYMDSAEYTLGDPVVAVGTCAAAAPAASAEDTLRGAVGTCAPPPAASAEQCPACDGQFGAQPPARCAAGHRLCAACFDLAVQRAARAAELSGGTVRCLSHCSAALGLAEHVESLRPATLRAVITALVQACQR